MLDDWKIKHCEGALEATQEIIERLQSTEGAQLEKFFKTLFDEIMRIYQDAMEEARNTTNENISTKKRPKIWHNILSQTHRLTESTWSPTNLGNLFNKKIDEASLRTLLVSAIQVFQQALESLSFQIYKFKPLETMPNVENFLQQIDQSEQETISYIGGWVIFSLSTKRDQSPKQLEFFKQMTKEIIDKKRESRKRYRQVVLTKEATTFVFNLEALLRGDYFMLVDPNSIDPKMLETINESLSTSKIL
jgi:hypothetical protein